MQPIRPTEVSRQSTNLFSATEVADTIGADLETIHAWLEAGAIDRAVFGGGWFSKYELQRAALRFELVKFGLSPLSARDVVWEMEYELQQIWARHYFESIQSLRDSNSKQTKEMDNDLVLEGINGRDRPIPPKSYYSTHI